MRSISRTLKVFAGLLLVLLASTALSFAEDQLVVGVSSFPPLVAVRGDDFSGFDIELWQAIADKLDIEYRFEERAFPEVLSEVAEGKVDVALAGISVTEEREKLVDFSHHYMDSGLLALVSSRSAVSILTAIGKIINRSTILLLLGFVVFTLVCGNVLWLSERGSDAINDHYFPGIFEALWCTLATATTVGYGDVVPKKLLGRLAALFVMIAGIGFFGILSAELMSALTTLRLSSGIEHSADLKGKRVAAVRGTTSIETLRGLQADVRVVDKIEDAYSSLLKDKVDAVVFDAPVLRYHVRNEGAGKVFLAGDLFDEQYYGIAVRNGSPLREKINAALLHFRKDGTYREIYHRWFGAEDG